jgi:hypothetical protein
MKLKTLRATSMLLVLMLVFALCAPLGVLALDETDVHDCTDSEGESVSVLDSSWCPNCWGYNFGIKYPLQYAFLTDGRYVKMRCNDCEAEWWEYDGIW